MINIHFAKRVFVKRIRMFLDFENDESYTPTKISVMSGTGYHDLQEVTTMNFEQPSGWIDVNLDGVHEEYVILPLHPHPLTCAGVDITIPSI